MYKKWPVITPNGRVTARPQEIVRWEITSNAWRNTFFGFAKILASELGWEKTTQLAGSLWLSDWVHNGMLGFIRKFDIKDKDVALVSKIMQYELQIEGFDIDLIEEAPERAVLRMTTCPWWRPSPIPAT